MPRYAVGQVEIQNTTKKALKVLLPGGKKLFLGPNAKGQITPKALDHPPVKKLLENGDIQVVGNESNQGPSPSNHPGGISSSQPGHGGGSGIRRSGDR